MKKTFWASCCIILLTIALRIYNLGNVPPSLYWDQASLGYDAYSILKTGKDVHGHSYPLVAFESFGDWKPAGYFYLIIPFIWLLGLKDIAVILPSVVAGVLLVIGVGKLAQRVGISPLAALFVASISPWALQFSRSAWESNVATACIVWAVYFGFLAVKKRVVSWKYLSASVFLSIFSMYTYHSAKIVAPLLVIGLLVYHLHALSQGHKVNETIGEWLKKNALQLLIPFLLGCILIFPLLKEITSAQNTHRFQETNIFSNLAIIEKSNLYKENEQNSVLSKIFYHRYILFANEVLKNYFSHFTVDFLFLSGDPNPRHSVQFYGELYHVEIIFLFLGAYLWIRRKTPEKIFLFYWLGIAILPASITTGSPHALRILSALPVFLLIVATGLEEAFLYMQTMIVRFTENKNVPQRKNLSIFLPLIVIAGIYLAEFAPYWTFYQNVYPVLYSSEWQYGYTDLMQYLFQYKKEHPEQTIYITREQGRPAMYYWYENAVDPRQVQQAELISLKDQGEFLDFDGIHFITDIKDVNSDSGTMVGSPEFIQNFSQNHTVQEIKVITDLKNKPIWKVVQFTK